MNDSDQNNYNEEENIVNNDKIPSARQSMVQSQNQNEQNIKKSKKSIKKEQIQQQQENQNEEDSHNKEYMQQGEQQNHDDYDNNEEQLMEQQEQEQKPEQKQQQQEQEKQEEKFIDCDNCQKLDEKIIEQQITKEKLELQSKRLRENIKELEAAVETVVNQGKEDNKKKSNQVSEQEKELEKQLKHHNAIYLSYKRKLNDLQQQFNVVENKTVERATEFRNEIQIVDSQIEKLQTDMDIMAREIRENKNIIQIQEPNENLKELQDEAKDLRKEYHNIRNENKQKERDMLVVQEKLTRIKKRIQNYNKSNGLISQTLQQKNDSGLINQKVGKLAQQNYERKKKEKKEFMDKHYKTEEQVKEMKRQFEQVTKQFKREKYQQQKEIEILQNLIEVWHSEKKIIDKKIKEATKESSILNHRQKGLQRYQKHHQLPPLEFQQNGLSIQTRSYSNVKLKDYIANPQRKQASSSTKSHNNINKVKVTNY